MEVVSAQKISGKKVILRYDIDVPISSGKVTDDFRLKRGLDTLKLCLEHATGVVMIGHVGRPNGKDPNFSVAPIFEWLKTNGFANELANGKLKLLENLRFESGEEASDPQYAKRLAEYGDFFVNEAFAAYRPAASTTVLPSLLPHAAGLRFAREVEKLSQVRNNPQKPYVAIMGGVKVEDKLPVIKVLAQSADTVLVGGKLVAQIKDQNIDLPSNVMVGKMTEDGLDIAESTVLAWEDIIRGAKEIVWNGPVGKIDIGQLTIDNLGSAKSTYDLAQIILQSSAESVVVGGGDTVGFLASVDLLDKFETHGFVSTGGGAMLKFLSDGTLPTIQALL